jgi:hypothetical protein
MLNARTPQSSSVLTLAAVVLICGSSADADAAQSADGGQSSTAAPRIEITGFSEIEGAAGSSSEHSQKVEWLLQPTVRIELGRRFNLTAVGRLRGDVFDELEPSAPPQSEVSPVSRRWIIGDRVDLELRELYLSAAVGRTLLRLGKQQIVWGNADGLKVLDVVNPQDFREFILDEFDQSRLPLWSAHVEMPIANAVLQAVWIPDRSYHRLPEPHSTFAFTAPALLPAVPADTASLAVTPLARPRHIVADSDVGLRISTFWKGWDLAAIHLFHYDDFVIPFQERSFSASGVDVIVSPRYKRTHLLGGTISNAFGSLTVRGELGASFDRSFTTRDPRDADGIVKAHELAYVIGFDWFASPEALLSMQVFQTRAMPSGRNLVREPVETTFTVLFRRELLNDTLSVETMWLQNVPRGDGLVRPKITYRLRDDLVWWLGTDLFFGNREGLFGQFATRDRLLAGIRWWFSPWPRGVARP